MTQPSTATQWVNEVDEVCEAVAGLEDLKNDYAQEQQQAAARPGTEEVFLSSYLMRVTGRIEDALGDFSQVSPTSFTGGDALISSYIRELEHILPEVGRLAEDVYLVSGQELRDRGRLIADLITSVEPEPDLTELVAADTGLQQAYQLASNCHFVERIRSASPSPLPLPAAADGSNVEACRDGQCQIAFSGYTDIPVGETLVLASIEFEDAVFRLADPDGGIGVLTISGQGVASNGDVVIEGIQIGEGVALVNISTW